MEIEKVPIRAYIIGAIFVAVLTGFFALSSGTTCFFNHYIPTRRQSGFMPAWGFLLMVALIISAIQAKKRIFSTQELAVLYTMIPMGLFLNWVYCHTPVAAFFLYSMGPAFKNLTDLYAWVPPFWGPKNFEYQIMIGTTSVPVDWGLWMPSITWAILFILSAALSIYFLTLLIVRPLTTIEVLPVVAADVPVSLIETGEEKKGLPSLLRSKLFWIGFLVQFALAAPVLKTVFDFVALYRPPATIWGFPIQGVPWENDYSALALLPWVQMTIYLWPWWMGWGYMMSVETLVSYLVGWIIFIMLVPVLLTVAGVLPPHTPGSGVGAQYLMGGVSLPNVGWGLWIGILLAIGFYPVWRARARMFPILKALVSKPPAEIDSESPMPYRLIWVGFIVSTVLWIVMGIVSWADPLVMTLFVILTLLVYTGVGRLLAETGGFLGGGTGAIAYGAGNSPSSFVGAMMMDKGIGNLMGVDSPTAFATYVLTHFNATGSMEAVYGYTMSQVLIGFKTAEVTKTSNKDINKAMLIGLVITVIAMTVGYVIWTCATTFLFGWKLLFSAYYGTYLTNTHRPASFWANIRVLGAPSQLYYEILFIIVGVIISIVVFMIREKAAWFRITPVGFALAYLFGSWGLAPLLIALVAKWLTLRLGGAEAYRQKGWPLAVGLVLGWCVAMFIFGFMGYLHEVDWYGTEW